MKELIGQILLRKGATDEESLASALVVNRAGGGSVGEILVEHFGVKPEMICRCLADQFGLSFLGSAADRVNEKLLHELPAKLFRDGSCFPLGSDDDTIEVAIADPLDFNRLLDLQAATGLLAQPVLTTPAELERCRNRFFGNIDVFTRA